MRVLVGCEFSGRVREAFRDLGHDAYSCDLLPASDGSVWHLRGDLRDFLGADWALLVAFPPCTYLARSGIHWNSRIEGRATKTEEALSFIRLLLAAPIPRICIENPIGVINSRIRRPDQIVQPWQFGDNEQKTTCLWLKNLPPLTPTVNVRPTYLANLGLGGQNRVGSLDRARRRSITPPGLASAMAEQWG